MTPASNATVKQSAADGSTRYGQIHTPRKRWQAAPARIIDRGGDSGVAGYICLYSLGLSVLRTVRGSVRAYDPPRAPAFRASALSGVRPIGKKTKRKSAPTVQSVSASSFPDRIPQSLSLVYQKCSLRSTIKRLFEPLFGSIKELNLRPGGTMPYLKITAIAGRTVEVYKTYSARYGKRGIPRGTRVAPTPERQQRINEKNAETRLRLKLNANFGPGDYHAVFTYRRENRPMPGQARKHRELFIRKARAAYRAAGLELKYIAVTEYKRKAIHHHFILSHVDPAQLTAIWPHGRVHITPLDNSGQYGQLAAYLIKETGETFREGNAPFGCRYTCSRNLKEPEIKREVIEAQSWRQEPKPVQGYALEKDSVRGGVHEATGWPWQFYRMIQCDHRKEKPLFPFKAGMSQYIEEAS